MIGNGWLRESPSDAKNEARRGSPRGMLDGERPWPQAWNDVRGKSALRKCMFLPLSVDPNRPAPPVSPAAMAPMPRPRPEEPIVPHRRNPNHDVRLLPAVSLEDVYAAKKRALYAEEKAKVLGKLAPARAWYEDPIALGTLLILVPPIGLAALWSSKRYSNDARWALTVMTALTLCLGAVIVIAVMSLRA